MFDVVYTIKSTGFEICAEGGDVYSLEYGKPILTVHCDLKNQKDRERGRKLAVLIQEHLNSIPNITSLLSPEMIPENFNL